MKWILKSFLNLMKNKKYLKTYYSNDYNYGTWYDGWSNIFYSLLTLLTLLTTFLFFNGQNNSNFSLYGFSLLYVCVSY